MKNNNNNDDDDDDDDGGGDGSTQARKRKNAQATKLALFPATPALSLRLHGPGTPLWSLLASAAVSPYPPALARHGTAP